MSLDGWYHNTKPIVYLAGGQQYSEDDGIGWRKNITPRFVSLGFDVFDPTKDENPIFHSYGKEVKHKVYDDIDLRFKIGGEIIDFDLKIFKSSCSILVYWDESAEKGSGTKAEITWSRQFDKPCYVVLAPNKTINDLPLWTCGGIQNPKNVFSSFDKFFDKFENDFYFHVEAYKLRSKVV